MRSPRRRRHRRRRYQPNGLLGLGLGATAVVVGVGGYVLYRLVRGWAAEQQGSGKEFTVPTGVFIRGLDGWPLAVATALPFLPP